MKVFHARSGLLFRKQLFFAYNRKKMEQSLVKHAESHNEKFEDLYNVIPIRQMKADSTTQELRYMEQAHQMVLKSKFPHGLNLR